VAKQTRSKRDYTCKKATSLITDYVIGTLASDITRKLERHLSACPDCVAFLKTYKKTIQMTRFFLASGVLPEMEKSRMQALRKNISNHGHPR
jgi:anti-sigma factor RsiW